MSDVRTPEELRRHHSQRMRAMNADPAMIARRRKSLLANKNKPKGISAPPRVRKRRENMSEAQKDLAAELREAGWTYDEIALKIGRDAGSVAWHCLAVGADPPNAKPIDKTIKGPPVYRRGRHHVRRFTPEDDAELIRRTNAGENPAQVGRALGRKPNSIRGRLMTLARHDAREEAAREKAR